MNASRIWRAMNFPQFMHLSRLDLTLIWRFHFCSFMGCNTQRQRNYFYKALIEKTRRKSAGTYLMKFLYGRLKKLVSNRENEGWNRQSYRTFKWLNTECFLSVLKAPALCTAKMAEMHSFWRLLWLGLKTMVYHSPHQDGQNITWCCNWS